MTATTTDAATSDAALTHYVDTDQLARDVAIDTTNLSDALRTHASNYVHYAVQAARARRQFERWKSALEVLEARLDGEYRVSLAADGKKPTEAAIKAAIAQDTRWIGASSRVIDAQQIFKFAEIAERAFDQRRDMLLQVARDAAREQEGQLRMRVATAAGGGVPDARESAAAGLTRIREAQASAAA